MEHSLKPYTIRYKAPWCHPGTSRIFSSEGKREAWMFGSGEEEVSPLPGVQKERSVQAHTFAESLVAYKYEKKRAHARQSRPQKSQGLLYLSLYLQDPEEKLSELSELFRPLSALKIKMPLQNIERELEALRDINAFFKGALPLRLDFNGGLAGHAPDMRQRIYSTLKALPLDYVEDPGALPREELTTLPWALDTLSLYPKMSMDKISFAKLKALVLKSSLFPTVESFLNFCTEAKARSPKIELIWSHCFEGPLRTESYLYLFQDCVERSLINPKTPHAFHADLLVGPLP